MEREFEALEEARKLHQEKYNCEGVCPDFIKGVEWADSHPKRGLVNIEDVIHFMTHDSRFDYLLGVYPDIINDTRKAMLKEE